MELHGSDLEGDDGILLEEEVLRKLVGLGNEDRVGGAPKAGENVGTEILKILLVAGATATRRRLVARNNAKLTVTGQMK